MTAIKTVAVVENRRIPSAVAAREEVGAECRRRGLRLQDSVGETTDLVIAIGGDGTVLRAAAMISSSRTLLYGMKHGKVGFLTNTVTDIPGMLDRLLAGRCILSPRLLLSVATDGVQERCLNEAVIQRATCRICSFSVSTPDGPVMAVRADALIASTPTGCTGHLLAAGGPILMPEVEAYALMAIAPHALACRPVVLPTAAALTIRAAAECSLVCDGQREYRVQAGQEVVVRPSSEKLSLVVDAHNGFFEKLAEKFGWGLAW